jgi:N-methylhydantoinase A
MQSNGGALTVEEAGRHAVRTVLSGPAGGVVGAFEMARRAGHRRLIGFDMGGTSTDVCLCEGRASETAEASVDGFPVRVPMLDVHTVGAGGGSIARIDAGGLLRVGPESAGADPGPACYGRGDQPTVTDAHVVLGHLDHLLGGAIPLDRKRAERALRTLGLSPRRAAEGVVRVANANMERAIRAVSVERGHDPAGFALLAFGGCGGLHACDLAESLGMKTVLAPLHAGVLSAVGMLLADRIRDYAAGVLGLDWQLVLANLEARAREENPGSTIERQADVRYRGQSYEITTPLPSGPPSLEIAARRFEALHRRLYGHKMPRPVEIVTVRVRARFRARKPKLAVKAARPQEARGPLVIHDYGSTLVVNRGWNVRQDAAGTLVLTRK